MGHILVVEDDDLASKLIRLQLRFAEHSVDTRATGLAGIERAREIGDALDLIVLDVNLGPENGYQVARHIRWVISTRITPILFISANNPTAVDRTMMEGLGHVIGFLIKPYERTELVKYVQQAIDLRRELRDDHTIERRV